MALIGLLSIIIHPINILLKNLTTTTQYRALVQNGSSCSIDSSAAAIITVDPKSAGGVLSRTM
ncbi:MAG: hypothetical protein WDO19_23280 [Bacteroidota bacterium]